MKRLFRLVYRVVIPLALLLLVVWAGVGVIQTLVAQQNERADYAARQPTYAVIATAIAPVGTESPSGEARDRFGGVSLVMGGEIEISQLFATNTPRAPIAFATNTPADGAAAPEATATPQVSGATEAPLAGPTPTFGPLPTILFLDAPADASAAPTAIPTAFPVIDRKGQNLLNILLMGQDNEVTGETLARTDTMIIVSINRDTNTVAMLSLPRDLYVYMPGAASGGMGRLNVAYGVGSALGWDGGPFFYMRQVILYNLGINVHYFAMIDLSGFAELIDSIGGVDVSVDCPIQDFQIRGAEVPAGAILNDPESLQYTLPIGYYHLSGKEALWYARSRGNSDDFDRGRRQQQIIRAAFRSARDQGLLTDVARLPGLISDGLAAVDTDLRAEDVLGLIPSALRIDPAEIETFRLIRTYHTQPWQPPDGQFVQLPQAGPIFDLMTDFYTPPTGNQVELRAARIRVLNGTSNPSWDRVAADRLGEETLFAFAGGDASSTAESSTILIDYTGSERGSLVNVIAETLRIHPDNVRVQPDPNREVDYEVIVGADFNPCGGAVLDPEP